MLVLSMPAVSMAAVPTLAVNECLPNVMACRARSASAGICVAATMSATRNSSPPTRPMADDAGISAVSAWPIETSASSPVLCPLASLSALKRSRSIITSTRWEPLC